MFSSNSYCSCHAGTSGHIRAGELLSLYNWPPLVDDMISTSVSQDTLRFCRGTAVMKSATRVTKRKEESRFKWQRNVRPNKQALARVRWGERQQQPNQGQGSKKGRKQGRKIAWRRKEKKKEWTKGWMNTRKKEWMQEEGWASEIMSERTKMKT